MEISSWQQELREIVRDPQDLLEKVGLTNELDYTPQRALQSFPVRVPESYVNRMRFQDPEDPLLLQVLPSIQEDSVHAGFLHDPVGDLASQTTPGLLHKYHGRVLLLVTGACAIHCRYCFRQHFPYNEANPAQESWQAALTYIREDSSITEVILSGGDPLTLSDEKLAKLISELEGIPHLKRLRIHSRIPVVLPSRITDALGSILSETSLSPVIVIHSNHANELSKEASIGLRNLKAAGVTLLNQCVLLKNINDDAKTLSLLNEELFSYGVLPYYLNVMDKVQGSAHFVVPDDIALSIMETLRTRLPGYLVPRLVREVAGKPYKLPLI